MKTFISMILMCFSINLFSQAPQPATIKMATFTVNGNCEECKKRIENAADIKGVKLAVWDEKTQDITVTYRPDKVNLPAIQKAIAASGHDAGDLKASDAGHEKLPKCCQYRNGKCEDPKKK